MARREQILDGLDPTTRQRVDEALRSSASRRPLDVYREFGLEGRGVKLRAWYAYCKRLRRRLKHGPGSEAPPPEASPFAKPRSLETLLRLLSLLNQRIDAGDVRTLPHVSTALRAITDCLRLTNEDQAERRAVELHELRVSELRSRLKADVVARTEGGKTLTREDVSDLIDQVMRGAA